MMRVTRDASPRIASIMKYFVHSFLFLVCTAAITATAHAQTVVQQTPLNRIDRVSYQVYGNDFESGISDVIVLSGSVSATTVGTEVITGSRSMKLTGGSAYAQMKAENLALQPGRSYVLSFRYR